MGAWGVGLYSGDFASDLRSAVAAVARLPLDETQLVDALCATEPVAAETPDHSDHTVFWLVLADQFEKRGIANARVRDLALSIIDGGRDADLMSRLGMKPADLRKRGKILEDLRARLVAQPGMSRSRSTMRRPDPYTMDVGGVYAWPTLHGHFISPFLGNKHFDRAGWKPDGFGVMAIVERGRAFDFLAWYTPVVMAQFLPAIPDRAAMLAAPWYLKNPGTCSTAQFRTLELREVAKFAIDPAKLDAVFPTRTKRGAHWAISGIPITESMTLSRFSHKLGQPPVPVPGGQPGRAKVAGLQALLAVSLEGASAEVPIRSDS